MHINPTYLIRRETIKTLRFVRFLLSKKITHRKVSDVIKLDISYLPCFLLNFICYFFHLFTVIFVKFISELILAMFRIHVYILVKHYIESQLSDLFRYTSTKFGKTRSRRLLLISYIYEK